MNKVCCRNDVCDRRYGTAGRGGEEGGGGHAGLSICGGGGGGGGGGRIGLGEGHLPVTLGQWAWHRPQSHPSSRGRGMARRVT